MNYYRPHGTALTVKRKKRVKANALVPGRGGRVLSASEEMILTLILMILMIMVMMLS